MNVQEFIRSIGKSSPPPFILFCPAKAPRAREATFEPLLAERAVERIVAQYVDPSLKDLAYAAFYADETKAGEIVLEAQTLPFLAERRVILVRNAEKYNSENEAKPLLNYLADPCETTLLVMIASQIDKRMKFYKVCEKHGLVVDCPELSRDEAAKWVAAEVQNRGKSIEGAAVQEIVRRAGTHLGDLNNAVGVVVMFVGDSTSIRESDVVAACADVAEEEVWALTDAIANSEPSKALLALRKLTDLGRHEDELIGTINWLLRSAYTTARPKAGPETISSFVANKVRPLANKLGLAKLVKAFSLCTDTQFMMRTTGVDRTLALELLVVKLAMPIRRA